MQDINWQDVGEEIVRIVQGLLRLDTRNPPGNEVLAAEYLHALLSSEGISGQIVGPSRDRATFVACLKGDGSARPRATSPAPDPALAAGHRLLAGADRPGRSPRSRQELSLPSPLHLG